jgi:hypothetical protein
MFDKTLDNLGQRNFCFPSPFPLSQCMACTHQVLELKTQPRYSPNSSETHREPHILLLSGQIFWLLGIGLTDM